MNSTTDHNQEFRAKALDAHRKAKQEADSITNDELVQLIREITTEIVQELLDAEKAEAQKTKLAEFQLQVAALKAQLSD